MKKMIVAAVMAGVIALSGQAFAHSPLMSCFDNGDGTVTCEGGFSDGSSASGVTMAVKGPDGQALQDGKMNQDGEYSFKKPEGSYTVVFDAGEGHSVVVNGSDIVE
jgi:type 1 fimbria pilin